VTQQELLDALWPDVHVQPEIVKTYIRDLRRILGDRPKTARFIQTRPRRGYTFVAAVTDENGLVPVATPSPSQPTSSGDPSACDGARTPHHPERGDGLWRRHHGGARRSVRMARRRLGRYGSSGAG
jgi:DNA-binding winged helix-turn-helix (wHTH) protein